MATMDPIDLEYLNTLANQPPPAAGGSIEAQARADIAALGSLTGGVRATLAQMAYALARALDAAYLDPDAPLSAITAGSKVLLQLMTEVAKTADASDKSEQFARWLSDVRAGATVGDPTHPEPADDGRQGRDHRADAGQAADAVAAVRGGR